MKFEYKKRFGTNISDFELLTTRVDFSIGGIVDHDNLPHIVVSRTATGALAKYVSFKRGIESFKIQLSMVEWLDFIRALCKNKVDKWENYYDYNNSNAFEVGRIWDLKIFSLDNGYFRSGGGAYPSNWDKFIKVIDGMIGK